MGCSTGINCLNKTKEYSASLHGIVVLKLVFIHYFQGFFQLQSLEKKKKEEKNLAIVMF